ncbi:MAG TPA: DinB family protein, partial [Pirellulaceae bacterium]|nr:DinB family protein [Pirellulaceae bacterium]
MNAKDAIKISIDMGQKITLDYLKDLTDKELLHRPAKGANHINWQLGHLIESENQMGNMAVPGSMPPLPAGFAEKYTKDTATSDDASKFLKKDELLKLFEEQRVATRKALDKSSEADLDKPTGQSWAPTVASLFSMAGTHWVMHAGQWAVVRRQLGRPPLF